MELHTIDETDGFEGVEGLGLGEGDSLYFTPSGTPLRFVKVSRELFVN